MAITFGKITAYTDVYIPAHNNWIVEFSDTAKTQDFAEVTYGGYTLSIDPINDNFYINMRELFRQIIRSQRTSEDETTISGGNNYTSVGMFRGDMVFTITFTDATTSATTLSDITIFDGVTNRDEYRTGYKQVNINGRILHNDTITLFRGYPFDLMHVEADNAGTLTSFTFANRTTGENYTLSHPAEKLRRTYLHDGRSLVIEGNNFEKFVDDTLDLSGGFILEKYCYDLSNFGTGTGLFKLGLNECILQDDSDGEVLQEINVRYVDGCGFYVRWLNDWGGMSYWLFNRVYTKDIETQTSGLYVDDFNNMNIGVNNESRSPTKVISKSATDVITLRAFNLVPDQVEQLKSILTSPRIWIYDADKGTEGTQRAFFGYNLVDGSFQLVNGKRNLQNLQIQLTQQRYER